MTLRAMGWRRGLDDINDIFAPELRSRAALPPSYDMESWCPPIWDQGSIGSCTAHGSLFVYMFTGNEQAQKLPMLSRRAQYYLTRLIEGTQDYDSGAYIRDSFKAMNKYGVVLEANDPYLVTKYREPVSQANLEYAATKRLMAYARVIQSEQSIKGQIAANNPICFGCTVYTSLQSSETARTGLIPMPRKGESTIGGHCMAIVGYDDNTRLYKVRNSWGSNWGKKGYGYMPYEYIHSTSLSADFWTASGTPMFP